VVVEIKEWAERFAHCKPYEPAVDLGEKLYKLIPRQFPRKAVFQVDARRFIQCHRLFDVLPLRRLLMAI
jgi:hypothetical protein